MFIITYFNDIMYIGDNMEEVNELEELEEQVKLLEDRIYVLERRDASRRARGWLKILFNLLLIGAVIFGVFYAYNYVINDLPKLIENQVKEKGNNIINDVTDKIKGN